MRAADGTKLTEENLEYIRKSISGDGTMKLNKEMNLDDPELEGKIFLLITDEDGKALANNLMYFPLFRVLSKAYHQIAMNRKMKRHEEKLKCAMQ